MSAAFARLAIKTASTKRPPALVGGKRGEPVAHLASFKCTPLDPVNSEILQRLALDTPHEVLQTFVDAGLDIQEGDTLVVGSREYPIRAVGDWDWGNTTYRHVIVEDLKR